MTYCRFRAVSLIFFYRTGDNASLKWDLYQKRSDFTSLTRWTVFIIKIFEFQPHKAPPAAVRARRCALHQAEYLKYSVMGFQALNQTSASENRSESFSFPGSVDLDKPQDIIPLSTHRRICEPGQLRSLSSGGAVLPSAARHAARAGWGVSCSNRPGPPGSVCVSEYMTEREGAVWGLNDEREEEAVRTKRSHTFSCSLV